MRSGVLKLARLLNGRRRRLVAGAAVLAGVVAAAAASHGQTSAGVLKVRLGGDSHQTRVVIEMDRPTHGRLISDGHSSGSDSRQASPQVELALAHLDVAGDMQGPGAGLVRGWAVSEAAGAAQVRLDLARPAQVTRRFLLPPGDGTTVYRYVIDLSADAAGAAAPPAPRRLQVQTAETVEAPPPPLHAGQLLVAEAPGKKVIVIDAGHGGKDPGAEGGDAREKDITLAAAHALHDRLERTGRYKVVLTRDTDVYIPLETRVKIARRANADLFLSLHADSGTDPSLRGATVYTLSEQGADRADQQVFEKANWIGVDLPGSDESVNRILLDLTQRQTRNRSSVFAESLVNSIENRVVLQRRSHRDAGFMVLLAPDVPAALLEMGFITNPADEHELQEPSYRGRLMDGVVEAINSYFDHESQIAAR